jgi:3-hydroxyisobutyrate dehydrogenase-like beta-hydroxyacid dehydrogenase
MSESMAKTTAAASVSVLGLGNMGSALAEAFIAQGHRVTVWNRNPARSRGFTGRCRIAGGVAEACRDADVVVACLASYGATREVLEAPGPRSALQGRVLVQLSTGIPAEAEQLGTWAKAQGARYLDGKIAVTPGRVGAPQTVIFYAGQRDVFDAWRPVLTALGGRPTFVGETLGQACIADFAFLSFYFAGILGILYGAAFCQAADMNLSQFFEAIPSFTAEMVERAPSFRKMMTQRDYSQAQSTLKVDLAGARLLAQVAEQTGLAPRFPGFLVDILQDGVAGGLGEADTAALTELFLRAKAHPPRP